MTTPLDDLIEQLSQAVDAHGVDVVQTLFGLLPIAAYAKGISKAHLDEFLSRWQRGLTANAVISLSPGKKVPLDFVETGGYALVSPIGGTR